MRRLEFGTLEGIIGCVGAGMGITMLPRAAVARAEADGRVALHALPTEEARVETVLVRRRDAFVSNALARFIEIAQQHLAVRVDASHDGAHARMVRPVTRGVGAGTSVKIKGR